MAGIPRYTPKIFGSGLTPTGNIADFGSKAGGTPTYSGSPQTIQTAQWLQGIFGALTSGEAPYWQDENGFRFALTTLVAYIMERGICEWDSNLSGGGLSLTTYYQGDLVRRGPAGGPNITVYQCQSVGGITTDPLTDGTNWIPWINTLVAPNLLKGSVIFDGTAVTLGNCLILGGFNVATVAKIATGHYRVNFTNALPTDLSGNGIYGFAGSAGTQNGATSIGGDNNTICGGGLPGTVVVKSGTQCDIFCLESNFGGVAALEDSACVSVSFF